MPSEQASTNGRQDLSSSASASDPDQGSLGELTGEVLALAGLDPEWIERIQFTGGPTILPSSFRITSAAQVLVAAVSAAVANIAELRAEGQRTRPTIVVDATEACAAFQSERHLRLDSPVQLWDELAGHYRSRDGHIQFHTNFAHHRNALLAATECAPDADRAAVAAVVAEVDRFEMEQRVDELGGIAAALRTLDEWEIHPHRTHLGGRAPLLLTRQNTGSASPLGAAPPDRPLAGLRVLDFTRVIAGPVCTRTLAAYGADVLRIGAPELPVVESILPDTTLGKRFANADITTSSGRETVLQLVAEADVAVIGFRPGAFAGHGLGPEDLFSANPNLVLAEMSAFGPDGPWGGKRGFDSITQTATGIVSAEMEAYKSDSPRPLPCQLLDHGTGFLLALGVLSALSARHSSGGARRVEASLITTRNWLTSLGQAAPDQGQQLTEQDVAGYIETRDSEFGPVTHLRHPGQITGIAARWDVGPSTPGQHSAAWLDRQR